MDGDDLQWVTNEKIYCYFYNISKKIFVLKPLGFRKLSFFSEMRGIKGLRPQLSPSYNKTDYSIVEYSFHNSIDRHSGIVDRFNEILDRYNGIVDRYNEILYRYHGYNGIVDRYNGLVRRYNGFVGRYSVILDRHITKY